MISGTAGCSVSFEDGSVQVDFGGGDGSVEPSTPTYTYGGSPTDSSTSGGTATDDGVDSTATEVPGSTATEPTTSGTDAVEEYGVQGYGQDDYGG